MSSTTAWNSYIALGQSGGDAGGGNRQWLAVFIIRDGSLRWNDHDGSWGTETGIVSSSTVQLNTASEFTVTIQSDSVSVDVDGAVQSTFDFRQSLDIDYLVLGPGFAVSSASCTSCGSCEPGDKCLAAPAAHSALITGVSKKTNQPSRCFVYIDRLYKSSKKKLVKNLLMTTF